jgi:hypothetical protein
MELPVLETQLQEIESGFSNQEHYEESARVLESIEKHRQLKDNIQLLTEEWETLSLQAEQIKSEFENIR